MNDEVDIVQKDPLAFLVSFDVQGANSVFAESFFDSFGDRLIVSTGCAGANDEVVGETSTPRPTRDHDFLRLSCRGRLQELRSDELYVVSLSNGFYLTNRVDAC
jgi:hypothetical protein